MIYFRKLSVESPAIIFLKSYLYALMSSCLIALYNTDADTESAASSCSGRGLSIYLLHTSLGYDAGYTETHILKPKLSVHKARDR